MKIQRPKKITVMMSRAEHAMLRRSAAAKDLTISAYIRALVSQKHSKVVSNAR